MNFILNFKSKEYKKAYASSLKLSLETRLWYAVVSIIFFLSGELYVLIADDGALSGIIETVVIVALLLATIIAILIARKKKLRHPGRFLGAIDLIFITVFSSFVVIEVVDVDISTTQPALLFQMGYWWGIFLSLTNLISANWLIKWIQMIVCCVTVAVKLRLSIENPSILAVISSNILFLSICFYYIHERYTKMQSIERYRANLQAATLKQIIGDLYESVIIYSTSQSKVLYMNKSTDDLPFWQSQNSIDDNLKQLKILAIKDRAINVSSAVRWKTLTGKEQFSEFTNVAELFNKVSNEKFNSYTEQERRTNYLVEASYSVTTDSENEPSSFSIQILSCEYDGENVWALIIRDTTERETIIALRDNNEYKTRLLASVSHELRTPLNCSITFTEKAIEHRQTPDFVKNTYLRPSLNSCKLLLNVINDILDFSQIKANKIRLVYEEKDIIETLHECVDLLSIQAEKKGIYIKALGKEDLKDRIVKTDHNRLRQILLNLLSNAMKFTYEGGITVRITERVRDLGTSKHSRVIKFSVEDTGIGIKPEDQLKLFNAFEKIELGEKNKMNPTGVGLGLLISNDLARSLGPPDREKPIDLTSEVGVGSSFEFEILDQDSSKIHVMETFRNLGVQTKLNNSIRIEYEPEISINYELVNSTLFKLNDTMSCLTKTAKYFSNEKYDSIDNLGSCSCPPVLIADDDMFNIAALESILHSKNLMTESAFNGKIAVEKYLQRENNKCGQYCKPFSIVFMDCNMPVMDGYVASSNLRKMMEKREVRECPIIACTALVQPSEVERCLKNGMIECVGKPLMPEVLMRLLKKHDVLF